MEILKKWWNVTYHTSWADLFDSCLHLRWKKKCRCFHVSIYYKLVKQIYCGNRIHFLISFSKGLIYSNLIKIIKEEETLGNTLSRNSCLLLSSLQTLRCEVANLILQVLWFMLVMLCIFGNWNIHPCHWTNRDGFFSLTESQQDNHCRLEMDLYIWSLLFIPPRKSL